MCAKYNPLDILYYLTLSGSASTCVDLSLKVRLAAGMPWQGGRRPVVTPGTLDRAHALLAPGPERPGSRNAAENWENRTCELTPREPVLLFRSYEWGIKWVCLNLCGALVERSARGRYALACKRNQSGLSERTLRF